MKKLILVGAGETAQTIFQYFAASKDFDVVSFCVERQYIEASRIFDLPVISYEEVVSSPQRFKDHYFFVAVSYTDMNRVRERFFNELKQLGLNLASHVHPSSFIGPDVTVGENCLVYDKCSINYKVRIGDNSTICSGSVISHSSVIGCNVFIAPNTSVGGFSSIGNNAFIGIGAIVSDMKSVAPFAILSAGAVLFENASAPNIYKGNPARDSNISSETYLKLMKGIS
jgi:sugar O-acyltransferase (sialic acid O-acetyltransferase NeuD family)